MKSKKEIVLAEAKTKRVYKKTTPKEDPKPEVKTEPEDEKIIVRYCSQNEVYSKVHEVEHPELKEKLKLLLHLKTD